MDLREGLPLRSLLDSAPDGIVVVDESTTIVFLNRTAEVLFGYDHNELLGQPIEILVPEGHRAVHAQHVHDYRRAPQVRPMGLGLNLPGRKKDGTEFPVEISLSPQDSEAGKLFTAVVRDVSERKKLEGERNLLSLELETERERDRIAMDLHDGIMQDIYAASLTLELSLPDGPQRSADATLVERAIDQLHGVVRDIRSYIFDLRPREFTGTLAAALSSLIDEFSQNALVEVRSSISSEVTPDIGLALALYHIAHESLSNIQKHARATTATLKLSYDENQGVLEISDNGVGFDTSQAVSETHRGRRNIAARARSISAKLTVESAPGQGTRLSVAFPIHRTSDHG